MSQVKSGDTVSVHYTGRFEDDSVFDSSDGREPLRFKVGEKQVIPGFESGVIGMKVGDRKEVRIEAEDGYGQHHDHLVLKVEKEHLPADLEIEEGMQLQMSQPEGGQVIVTVTGIGEKNVTLDANHPMAGKNLIFDIELVEIL
jgi:peptidylprolyl isomerase